MWIVYLALVRVRLVGEKERTLVSIGGVLEKNSHNSPNSFFEKTIRPTLAVTALGPVDTDLVNVGMASVTMRGSGSDG